MRFLVTVWALIVTSCVTMHALVRLNCAKRHSSSRLYDDEVSRKGIKVEFTTHEEYLTERFVGLSKSGHDLTPLLSKEIERLKNSSPPSGDGFRRKTTSTAQPIASKMQLADELHAQLKAGRSEHTRTKNSLAQLQSD